MITPQPTPQYGQVERVSVTVFPGCGGRVRPAGVNCSRGVRRLHLEGPIADRAGGGARTGFGQRNVDGQRGQFLGVQVHHALVDLELERLRAAFVRAARAAIGQTDGPVVQRAGHRVAEHDALAQRAALVRAAVEQREDLVFAVAEDRDVGALCARHAARAEHRNVGDQADGFPFTHDAADSDGKRGELARVDRCLVELEPGIGLSVQRELQPLPQRFAARGVVQDLFLHVVEADPVHVMDGALQVPALFAVQLAERAGVLEHLFGGLELDEEMRDLGLDAAVAGHVHLPAGIDADDADVLDAGLGAVARAAADRELDLVRRIHAPHRALQVLAHLRAVLRAEAAPFAADAGLHGAQGLGVRVAAGHADVLPDIDQVFLLDAQQVDALAAGDLDGGDVVLVDRVGDAAQFVGRGLAAPHARDDRVAAVL